MVLRSSFSVGGRASRLRPGMMWSTMTSSPRAFSSRSFTSEALPRITTDR